MDLGARVLIAITGLAILGFLWQFGILRSIWNFVSSRLNRSLNDFEARQQDLADKETVLNDVKKAVNLTDEEMYRAHAAIKQERGVFAKKVVAASGNKTRDEINNMTIDNLVQEAEASRQPKA